MKELRVIISIGLILVAVGCGNGSSGLTPKLEWDAVTEDINGEPEEIFEYRVYYSATEGEYADSLSAGAEATFEFPADVLTPDTLYYVVVTAIDLAGNESDFSGPAEYRTPAL